MIKIQKLQFNVGDRVLHFDHPATVAGYIQYNSQFFYIVVRDGEEKSREAKAYYLEKAA